MFARILIAAVALLTLIALPHATHAQQTPGYALALYANLPPMHPMSPLDPFSVRAGTEIRYRIEHTVPSPVPDVEYYFETPPGTVFVAAQALEGASIRTQSPPETPLFAGPEGLGDVVIYAEPTAPTGSIEVTVRVNNIYQGPIDAIARFLGRGPGDVGAGASNRVTFQFDHGDGVPGQLVASSFVDMNGDGVYEMDDVLENCPVYVYRDLTGTRVPDDVASATDARLPLVSVGATTADGPARINLFPGRYSVLYGACDTPLTPSGAVETGFELIDRPPVTRILSESGASFYEVQTFDITSTQITEVVRAAQPVGATAPPTDLRVVDAVLLWTDRADGETSYEVMVNFGGASERFSLPANATQFVIPQRFSVECGLTERQVSVAAVRDGATGYRVSAQQRFIADCAFPQTLLPPNVGAGTTRQTEAYPPSYLIALIATAGAIITSAGLALRDRPKPRHCASQPSDL